MNSVVLTEGGEVWTWGEPWGEFALELQLAPRKVSRPRQQHQQRQQRAMTALLTHTSDAC